MVRHSEPVLRRERLRFLHRVERMLEGPIVALSLVWLILLAVELAFGLGRLGWLTGTVIWVIFIFDYLLRFTLAPDKLVYIRRNLLTLVSLLAPAVRALRLVRAVRLLRLSRAARGFNLIRVLTAGNRGMRAIGSTFHRRGFGYVLALTLAVTLLGAAGMLAFERDAAAGEKGLHDFGSALWWTAMLMTTMGSEYWPRTAEGRLLCLFLALYAFAVFGYVTAALAAFFVGRDAENPKAEVAGQQTLELLRQEIAALRGEVASLHGKKDDPALSDRGPASQEEPEGH